MVTVKKVGGIILVHYRLFLLGAIVIAASAVIQDPFQNIINVFLLQVPYIAIYAFGMTLAILVGGLDLSQGGIAAFSTCVGAMFIIRGGLVDTILGILICIAIGAVFGLLNGIIITKAKVPPFIATYGMEWSVRGLSYIMMGGAMIFGFTDGFRDIARGSILGISNVSVIAIVILVVLLFVTLKTTFGRNIYMVGANPQAAKLSGVNNDFVITMVFMISGALGSTAGILYVSRLNTAEVFLGTEFALTALAASLIGGTRQGGGVGGVINTIQGVMILMFVFNLLNVWRVSVLWHPLAFGVIIVFAALLEKARTAYLVKRLQ